MTAATIAARPDTLVDPVAGGKTWVHAATGRHYVPQGLRRYLLGRALDIVIVAATALALTKGAASVLQPTTLLTKEWQFVAVVGFILFAVIFLYGGIAGTVGTIGEAVTRMRVVNAADGSTPGFLAGGLRAVGWFLFVLFTVMLSDTGAADTRFVAVRRNTGVFPGRDPVPAAKP